MPKLSAALAYYSSLQLQHHSFCQSLFLWSVFEKDLMCGSFLFFNLFIFLSPLRSFPNRQVAIGNVPPRTGYGQTKKLSAQAWAVDCGSKFHTQFLSNRWLGKLSTWGRMRFPWVFHSCSVSSVVWSKLVESHGSQSYKKDPRYFGEDH